MTTQQQQQFLFSDNGRRKKTLAECATRSKLKSRETYVYIAGQLDGVGLSFRWDFSFFLWVLLEREIYRLA